MLLCTIKLFTVVIISSKLWYDIRFKVLWKRSQAPMLNLFTHPISLIVYSLAIQWAWFWNARFRHSWAAPRLSMNHYDTEPTVWLDDAIPPKPVSKRWFKTTQKWFFSLSFSMFTLQVPAAVPGLKPSTLGWRGKWSTTVLQKLAH